MIFVVFPVEQGKHMEKILIIGDPHFKASNLSVMAPICDEILALIDEHKFTRVVSCGDTLDTHERIHLSALCFAVRFYQAIAKKTKLVVLIGNHDRLSNQDFCSDVHPFPGLEDTPNITVVWTTVWDKENNFIYVPYVPSGRFNDALALVGYTPGDSVEPLMIFPHQELRNVIMGIKVSASGDPWGPHLPPIFSGHIHEHQVLPGAVYVGTFLQQNYGESSDKALMVVNLDRNKPKGSNFSYDRIRLRTAPIKTTIHMRIPDLPNAAEKIPPGHQVKVVLHLDATETKDIEKNPWFQSLKSMVDKVVKKVEGDKASIANNMVKEMKKQGRLAPVEKGTYKVEEIVRAMLMDDPNTLHIFESEICT